MSQYPDTPTTRTQIQRAITALGITATIEYVMSKTYRRQMDHDHDDPRAFAPAKPHRQKPVSLHGRHGQYEAALQADQALSDAIRAAFGPMADRWNVRQAKQLADPAVRAAYERKVAADRAWLAQMADKRGSQANTREVRLVMRPGR